MPPYTCKHSELALFSLPSPHFLVDGAAPRLGVVVASVRGSSRGGGGCCRSDAVRFGHIYYLCWFSDGHIKHGQHGDGLQQAELKEDPKEEEKSAD